MARVCLQHCSQQHALPRARGRTTGAIMCGAGMIRASRWTKRSASKCSACKCSALQNLRDERPHLREGTQADAMVLFMWQDDMMGVVRFIDACLERILHTSDQA